MGNISGQSKNDQIHLLRKILTYRIYFIKRPGSLLDFLDLQYWTKKMENLYPSPPKTRMGKWRGLAFARFQP